MLLLLFSSYAAAAMPHAYVFATAFCLCYAMLRFDVIRCYADDYFLLSLRYVTPLRYDYASRFAMPTAATPRTIMLIFLPYATDTPTALHAIIDDLRRYVDVATRYDYYAYMRDMPLRFHIM